MATDPPLTPAAVALVGSVGIGDIPNLHEANCDMRYWNTLPLGPVVCRCLLRHWLGQVELQAGREARAGAEAELLALRSAVGKAIDDDGAGVTDETEGYVGGAGLMDAVERKCRRHAWGPKTGEGRAVALGIAAGWPEMTAVCVRCGHPKDEAKSRRGRTTRSYGTRAELAVARTYGGTKVGHMGGPVDVLGTDWETQVKTHRRSPPAEWTKAFAALPGDKLPRILLRFVRPGLPPADYFVVPAKAWLDWHGKDE